MTATPSQTQKEDVQDLIGEVNGFLAEEIENGETPWAATTPPRRITGEPFQGINNLSLSTAQAKHGYTTPFWLTPAQAKAVGGQVREGEAGMPVLLVKTITDEDTGETRQEGTGYRVYNASQIDGLPEVFYQPATKPEVKAEDLDEIAAGLRVSQHTTTDDSPARYDRTNNLLFRPAYDQENHGQHVSMYSRAIAEAGILSGKVKTNYKHDGDPHRVHFFTSLTGAFAARHLGEAGAPPRDSKTRQAFAQVMRDDPNAIFNAASKAETSAKRLLENTTNHKEEKRKERYTAGLNLDEMKAQAAASGRSNAAWDKPNFKGKGKGKPTTASEEYRRQREAKRRKLQQQLDQAQHKGKNIAARAVQKVLAVADDLTR